MANPFPISDFRLPISGQRDARATCLLNRQSAIGNRQCPGRHSSFVIGQALLLALLTGCAGYQTRFALPPHLQTVCVSIFKNHTLERNVDYEFTQQLISELAARTSLRRVASEDDADLMVTGEIEKFDRQTLRRRSRGQKSEMQYVLYVNVTMLDRKKDVVFFAGKDLNWNAEFRMNLGETPVQAREEVIRDLARHVVDLAFEPWPKRAAEPAPPGKAPAKAPEPKAHGG